MKNHTPVYYIDTVYEKVYTYSTEGKPTGMSTLA